jgi:hypothetical protein
MVDYQADVNYVPQGSLEPGIFMLPVYFYGTSPLSVCFEVHCTPCCGSNAGSEYAVDFGDGSSVVHGTFDKPPEDGVLIALVPHTYVYRKLPSSQYTGRQFYPDVTIRTKSGAIKSLNHNMQKACSVWVRDSRFDNVD